MGDDLYGTRLRWYGYHGCAKLHGRAVALLSPPVISGSVVVSVDYVPEIGMRVIQIAGSPPRDMTHDEVHASDQLLLDLACSA